MKKRKEYKNKFLKVFLFFAFILILLGFLNLIPTFFGLGFGWIVLYFAGFFYFLLEGKPYRKAYEFFKKLRWFFLFSVGIFILFAVVGLIFPIFFTEEIISLLSRITISIEGKSLCELIIFIFSNNARSAITAFILGIGLGIFPLFILVLNGYVLGFVGNKVIMQQGLLAFWKILPHGIFELFAVFLATGIGIKIGTNQIFKHEKINLSYNYREGLRFFIFVIIPLLLIAAIIEGLLIMFVN
ncbi:MAG: stage II sporulation protein M [Candidatus Pacearchaeota archaeon]